MQSSVTFELKGDINVPGFKPLIWKLASEEALGGWITDEKDAVVMRLDGPDGKLETFIRKLPSVLFPVYRLRELRVVKREFEKHINSDRRTAFHILGTPHPFQAIRPDRAPCPDCLAEMCNPDSRRYHYPFWSCPECGPCYSALVRSPFLRANTYLHSFPPCPKCSAEYLDENNKLFYRSELLACPECGPRLFLMNAEEELVDDENPICSARDSLKDGKILALQSLFGGFQLFVDPMNRETLARLRHRKKIPARPIALMARDIGAVKKYCLCSEDEERLLTSPSAPIVILETRPECASLLPLDLISPDDSTLGISLPPTTLTSLLFEKNSLSGELPFDLLAVCSTNWDGTSEGASIDELLHSLRGIAEKFLCHDLHIGVDCVSSIAIMRNGSPQIWRYSRGYAPIELNLHTPLRRIAAGFGTDHLNSIALGFGDKVIPSQYIGEIRNADAAERSGHMIEHLCMMFDSVPDVIACDMNMTLQSSLAAMHFSEKYSIPLVTLQKHHAHAISCMAENGLEEALAFVFDNGSPGPDGTLWGAEMLEAKISSFRRLATFKAAELHTEKSVLRPQRQFFECMLNSGVELSSEWLEKLNIDVKEAEIWSRSHERQIGRPVQTHAVIHLFDAVAAGLGATPGLSSYTGQGAIRLANLAHRFGNRSVVERGLVDRFAFKLIPDDFCAQIDWAPTFQSFSDISWVRDNDPVKLAVAFYISLSESLLAMAEYGASKSPIRDVVLSGTCFSDTLFAELTEEKLKSKGFKVYTHHSIPPNDSGVAVGQVCHAGIAN